jgi:hypothetical protein
MVVGMAEAGQGYDEPLQREEEGHPHQDVFGRDLTHGDQPLQMDDGLDGQDATRAAGRFLEHVAVCLGLLGTCDRLQEPQRGQRFALLDADHAQKGPTSPF